VALFCCLVGITLNPIDRFMKATINKTFTKFNLMVISLLVLCLLNYLNFRYQFYLLNEVTLILSFVVVLWMYHKMSNELFYPLNYLTNILSNIAKGNIEEDMAAKKTYEMRRLTYAIHKVRQHLKYAQHFIQDIAQGNLETHYTHFKENAHQNNNLITALWDMREKLKIITQSENQRNWASKGFAQFAEIISKNNQDLAEMSAQLIEGLVHYVEANQGGFFVLDEDSEELKMIACYAYNRRKYMKKSFKLGEDLIGQCYYEAQTIYMTNVPNDYPHIVSGLGEASPRNILLVPFKSQDKVQGVIELASFEMWEKYQIEFVERLGENIASAISTVKINDMTRKLLKESQAYAESLRSQEEELRQNMEEMQATQEEMRKAQQELMKKEANLEAVLNNTEASIIHIDKDYRVVLMNDALKKRYDNTAYHDIDEGTNVLAALDIGIRQEWKAYYDRGLNGERFNFVIKSSVQGEDSYREYHINPVINDQNEIVGISVFSRDVTSQKTAELENKRLFEEQTKLLQGVQEQTEELKAQEEELRQNMEEMQATQEEMRKTQQELIRKDLIIESVINTIEGSVVHLDKDYRVVLMNDVLRKRYAQTSYHQMGVGTNVLDILDPEVRQEWKTYYDRGLSGEKFNFMMKSSIKGEESYRHYYINPVKDESDEIVGVSVFSRDVTTDMNKLASYERLLDAMIQQNNLFQSVLMYFELDKDQNILSINDLCLQMLALKKEEIIGKNIEKIINNPREFVDTFKYVKEGKPHQQQIHLKSMPRALNLSISSKIK
jgi:PAS domain-containing protein